MMEISAKWRAIIAIIVIVTSVAYLETGEVSIRGGVWILVLTALTWMLKVSWWDARIPDLEKFAQARINSFQVEGVAWKVRNAQFYDGRECKHLDSAGWHHIRFGSWGVHKGAKVTFVSPTNSNSQETVCTLTLPADHPSFDEVKDLSYLECVWLVRVLKPHVKSDLAELSSYLVLRRRGEQSTADSKKTRRT